MSSTATPHSGNVCIDASGDICFLDMGLLCALSEEDARLCRQFFLTAYSGNAEKLYQMLAIYGKMSADQSRAFRLDCQKYCDEVKSKDVTSYFTDMINICLNYEFVPPNFLFSMAKAFICLNGISHFAGNDTTARQLLQAQTLEYMLRRSLHDCSNILASGLHLVPSVITDTFQHGMTHALSAVATSPLRTNLKTSLENLHQMLDLAANLDLFL